VGNTVYWADSCDVVGAAIETCTGGTACQAGACVCVPQDHTTCVGNASYWVDSCGVQGAKVEDCTGGKTCQAGACVCVPQDHKTCVGSAVYWVDSCGVQGAKVQDCTGGQACQDGACLCLPQAQRTCLGNAAYWADSCGALGAKIEDCTGSQTCQSGYCGCVPQDYTTCVGDTVHWVDSCGVVGVAVETCTGGTTCQAGACACTNTDFTTCVGDAVYRVLGCVAPGTKVEDCAGGRGCVAGVCTCIPQDHTTCIGNAVYWADSCGTVGDKVADCAGVQVCQDGACTCVAQDHKTCVGNALYWVDSCGTVGLKFGDCTGGTACQAGACVCVPFDHKICTLGAMYWADSCGVRGEKSEDCPYGCNANGLACQACTPDCTGKTCGDDGCGGSCGACDATRTCLSGLCACRPMDHKECVGNAAWWFDSCNVQGTLYQSCVDGRICTSGVCECRAQETSTCIGNAVYWVDSCGVTGAKAQDCLANQRCEIDGVVARCSDWDGNLGACTEPVGDPCSGGLGTCFPDGICYPSCNAVTQDCAFPGAACLLLLLAFDDVSGPLYRQACTVTIQPPLGDGEACSTSNACEAGLQCIPVAAPTTCRRICSDASVCAASEVCNIQDGTVGFCGPWDGTYGPCDPAVLECAGGLGFCQADRRCLPRCDAIAMDCPAMLGSTLTCMVLSDPNVAPVVQVCLPTTQDPPGQEGDACVELTDCDLGLQCMTVGSVLQCVRFCHTAAGCGVNQQCDVLGLDLGICMPWDGTYGTCDPATANCNGVLGYCTPGGMCVPRCDLLSQDCPYLTWGTLNCLLMSNPSLPPLIAGCQPITASPPVAEDQPCVVPTDCELGLQCSDQGEGPRCSRLCADATACRPEQACNIMGLGLGFCGPWNGTYGPCDPASSSCNGGLGFCYVQGTDAMCVPVCSVLAQECPTIGSVSSVCYAFDIPTTLPVPQYCVVDPGIVWQEGDPCTDPFECGKGMQCIGYNGGPMLCHRFCATSAACTPPRVCGMFNAEWGVCTSPP
jgi:hypothetical protein